jgi:hypothetical protein
MSYQEKINEMVLKVKNYLVDVLKYDTEIAELYIPYFYDRNIRSSSIINITKNNIDYQENIYKKLEENLKKYNIVGVDIGTHGTTEINYHNRNIGKNTKTIINNHYIIYINSRGEGYVVFQLENPYNIIEPNLYINWGYEFISKPFLNKTSNDKIDYLDKSVIDFMIINNLFKKFYISRTRSSYFSIDMNECSGFYNYILNKSDFLLLTDIKALLQEKKEFEKKQIEKQIQLEIEKKEMEKQLEELNRIKILDENIKVSILDTSFMIKIENYYKPKINLKTYLPHKTKKFMKDGILNETEITNIIEVIFVDCDFIEITDYYEGIKIIRLNNCPNFKQIPRKLQTELSELFINDKLIEFS